MNIQGKIQSRRYTTRVSEISMDAEGIMHVVFSKGVEIGLSDMHEAYTIFREKFQVGPGLRKSRQLLSGGPFTLSKAARDFAGGNASDYFVAAAMVTDSTLTRLVINIFNAIQKHDVPFKLFSTETEALTWLRTFSSSIPSRSQ